MQYVSNRSKDLFKGKNILGLSELYNVYDWFSTRFSYLSLSRAHNDIHCSARDSAKKWAWCNIHVWLSDKKLLNNKVYLQALLFLIISSVATLSIKNSADSRGNLTLLKISAADSWTRKRQQINMLHFNISSHCNIFPTLE